MMIRFAAACAVGSVVIAMGSLGMLLLRAPVDTVWVLTTAGCFVPIVWGVWAVVTPPSWVPGRFPAWGAILGIVAGLVAGPLLRLPERFGAPDGAFWLAAAAGPILYFALWMIVRLAYSALCRPPNPHHA